MKRDIVIIAVIALSPLFSSAQDDNSRKMEVMMRMLSLKNSLIAKDSVSLSGLLDDEVSYGHTNGLIQTKAQLIRSVMSGEQDYKTIDPSDMVVSLYENTAIVTMKAKVSMIYQGRPLDMDMVITLAWIKQKDDWKLLARQSAKL